jgi:DNA-binding transcriptional MerR regulator
LTWHIVLLYAAIYSTEVIVPDRQPQDRMMRIGELAKVAGVTVQTIHFYLREGLLPPPTKTAPNMAYYGPEYLEDIRLIKQLQSERYLPLGLIRQLLETKREGHDLGQVSEMLLALDWAFGDAKEQAEVGPMTLPEYILGTGLSMEVVGRLEAMGLIGEPAPGPLKKGDGEPARPYDTLDLRLGRVFKTLLDSGLEPDDLEIYKRQLDLEREEAALIHNKMLHNRPRSIPRIPTSRLIETLNELGTVLTLRAVQQVATEAHEIVNEGDRGDKRAE